MNIDREKILRELENHVGRCARIMRQAATADHARLHNDAEIWMDILEADMSTLRRLFESFGLVESQGEGS